jgi:hypothetical protein
MQGTKLVCFNLRCALFNGVVESRESMSLKGSSPQSSSSVMPHSSKIHLDYSMVEQELRQMREEMAVERETNRMTQDYLTSYNAQMQAVVSVRKKNTFLAFIAFSVIYVLTLLPL